jgi:TetR/AcrR family transcriptional regulator
MVKEVDMQDFNETENRIIEAAAKVFLEKGKAGARTQVIADVAGINKALLHYYFRSKEKLYDIVAERVIRNAFNQILGNISEINDFETFLKQFLHNYLKTISSNPMIPRFMLWEIEAGGGRIAQIIKSILNMDDMDENPLFKIVNKAIRDKQIRPVDPIHFVISLIASCVAPFVARPIIEKVIPGLDIRSKTFVEQREKALFDLFWNGIKIEHCGADETTVQESYNRDWLLW